MKPPRRWFQYSLRSFLIVLTALAVWLGVVVRRATEQREAVKAIEALGGQVFYDWQLGQDAFHIVYIVSREEPPGPPWLRRIIGNEFFQKPAMVCFAADSSPTETDMLCSLSHLERMPGLSLVETWTRMSDQTKTKMRTALPTCDIRFFDE